MGFNTKHLLPWICHSIRSCTLTTILYCGLMPANAETLPIQEALVDLNTAVQEYQLGNRPDTTSSSHLTWITIPQSIQLESRIYIAEILYLRVILMVSTILQGSFGDRSN